MYPNNLKFKQAGIGLPVAIFIITIMSLIAAAVNQIGATSSQSYTQNLLSSRAFYAAESG
ncbi:MAG: MSHA biogenesis protein MshP, partial [Oleispira sp.]